MKMHRTLTGLAAATLSILLPSIAQSADTFSTYRLEEADKIVGRVLTDSHNQPVGKVYELAVDWTAGRVAEVFVDTGGYLTSHRRIVAIPPECLNVLPVGNGLQFTGAIDPFESAPEIDMSAWNGVGLGPNVIDMYKRFNLQPYGNPGRLERSGKIMGLPIQNPRNERLARVEAIIVALPGGAIPDVIISSTGGSGLKGGELTAIAPQAFVMEAKGEMLILDTTGQALHHAPHFKASEWRNAISGSIRLSQLNSQHLLNKIEVREFALAVR
jgi:hypothetical protein